MSVIAIIRQVSIPWPERSERGTVIPRIAARLFGRRFAVYDQRSTERADAARLEIINASAQVLSGFPSES